MAEQSQAQGSGAATAPGAAVSLPVADHPVMPAAEPAAGARARALWPYLRRLVGVTPPPGALDQEAAVASDEPAEPPQPPALPPLWQVPADWRAGEGGFVDGNGNTVGMLDAEGQPVTLQGHRVGMADGHAVLGGKRHGAGEEAAWEQLYVYVPGVEGRPDRVGRYDPEFAETLAVARQAEVAAQTALDNAQAAAAPDAERRKAVARARRLLDEALADRQRLEDSVPDPVHLLPDGRFLDDRLTLRESNQLVDGHACDRYDGMVDGALVPILKERRVDERSIFERLADSLPGRAKAAPAPRYYVEGEDEEGRPVLGDIVLNLPPGSARFARISAPRRVTPQPSPQGFHFEGETFFFAPGREPLTAELDMLESHSSIPTQAGSDHQLAHESGLRQIAGDAGIEHFIPIRMAVSPSAGEATGGDGAQRTALRWCRYQPDLRDLFAGHVLIEDPDAASSVEPNGDAESEIGGVRRHGHSPSSSFHMEVPGIIIETGGDRTESQPTGTADVEMTSGTRPFRSSSPRNMAPQVGLDRHYAGNDRPSVPSLPHRAGPASQKGPAVRYDPISKRWLAPDYHAEIQEQFRLQPILARTRAEIERVAGRRLSPAEDSLCRSLAMTTEFAISRWLSGRLSDDELKSAIVSHDTALATQLNAAIKDRALANIFQFNSLGQYAVVLSLGPSLNNFYQFVTALMGKK